MSISERSARDDRVLPETRWIGALIIPFLLLAFAILYFWPNNTEELFAWALKPSMTALLMGAGYLGGAYFFVRVVTTTRWHRVAMGFPAISVFTWFLGISTYLYLDRFIHSNIAFYAWIVLYTVTPFLVPALWLRNRRTDPGTPDQNDTIVPTGLRWLFGVLGAIVLFLCVVVFIWPDLALSRWPWPVTVLTARTLCGWFSLFGVIGLALAADRRWSAWRIVLQSQMIGIALILVGAIRAWGEFDRSNPLTWGFVGVMILMLAGFATLHLMMDARSRRVAQQAVLTSS